MNTILKIQIITTIVEQVIEPDIDCKLRHMMKKIQRIKQEHVNELNILQSQYLNDVQMLKLQVEHLENRNRMLINYSIKPTEAVGKF